MKKSRNRFWFGVVFFILLVWIKGSFVSCADEITIVIDPGHGGSNLGAQWDGHDEKDLTLITANAMKEYLELFDGVTVYMTREGDSELSLKERADFANDKKADFLLSLHYNMSEEHTLFGAEVWIPSAGEQYSKGYAFADVQMREFERMGLFFRGIKTRLNHKGTDYYGIIRNCSEYGIPAVVVEHCHLDQQKDLNFWNSEEKLRRFGVADATSVARYFQLKSDALGLDYSDYDVLSVPAPTQVMAPDRVPPEYCKLSLVEISNEDATVKVSVEAADADTLIHYVEFSYDGGKTWKDLQAFTGEKKEFVLQLERGTSPVLMARAYDMYDLKTESEAVNLEPVPLVLIIQEENVENDQILQEQDSKHEETEVMSSSVMVQNDLFLYGLLGVLTALFILLLGSYLSVYIVSRRYRKGASMGGRKRR